MRLRSSVIYCKIHLKLRNANLYESVAAIGELSSWLTPTPELAERLRRLRAALSDYPSLEYSLPHQDRLENNKHAFSEVACGSPLELCKSG